MLSPDRVQVDSHTFLQGRERRPPAEDEQIMGRQHGDSEKLFPRYTHASAAVTQEVTIGGRVLKLWTFQQLETLSRAVLRDRALDIRGVLGEAQCPPVPSGQREDFIRWILHMQSELAEAEGRSGGRAGARGQGHRVPAAFEQDTKERPITMEGYMTARSEPLPFGPKQGPRHDATRDHFADLKHQRNDFKEAPKLGIQTMRPGGEGRRHLPTQHNMVSCGVSAAEPRGIQTLKPTGEGRRYLACDDHLMEQKKELEAIEQGGYAPPPPMRAGADAGPHVSDTHMCALGVADPPREAPVAGDRRRHLHAADRMVNHGTSAPDREVEPRGRKYADGFAGPGATSFGDVHGTYETSWKKDPSRLQGRSLIV
mmetsp:Transcript_48056/g.153370  ORF Transcript_48056/g.153370 Transcript_48056/m.153370 type:complete len:369 (-) Transcript_48056:126-1232(-)